MAPERPRIDFIGKVDQGAFDEKMGQNGSRTAQN